MVWRDGSTSIYYETEGEGIPVVFLHGFLVDHRLMRACMEPVFRENPAARKWRRFYPDLPGMGKSPYPKRMEDADRMIAILSRWIDETVGEGPYLLAGQSYGAYLALGLAYKNPGRIDGLFLLCPVTVWNKSARRLPPHEVLEKDEPFLASLSPHARRKIDKLAVLQNERVWKRIEEEILLPMKQNRIPKLNRFQKEGYGFSFDKELQGHSFAKPSAILTGRQDASVGYADALARLRNFPRGTFALIEPAGHNLQIEQPALFESHLRQWLENVVRDRKGITE